MKKFTQERDRISTRALSSQAATTIDVLKDVFTSRHQVGLQPGRFSHGGGICAGEQ